jgi:methylmalonyl-CoA mutase N-terminal domain/subunit
MTAGILRGIETGWFNAEIADAAFAYQQAVEKGEKKQVGVNVHLDTIETPLEILRVSHEVERDQVAALRARRTARDETLVAARLAALGHAAAMDEGAPNLVPLMLDAARAEATLGEICDELRSIWGDYREAAFV